MEVLAFEPRWPVLICTRCQHALVPTGIGAHLKTAHGADVTRAGRKTAVDIWKNRQLLHPDAVSKLRIPPQTTPIQHLALYRDGIRCRLCLDEQAYICCTCSGMQVYF